MFTHALARNLTLRERVQHADQIPTALLLETCRELNDLNEKLTQVDFVQQNTLEENAQKIEALKIRLEDLNQAA